MIARQFFSSLFHSGKQTKKKEIPQEGQNFLAKKAEHFPFDFDRWYEKLHAYSFPSVLLPITPATAQAMVNYYQQRFNQRHVLTTSDVDIMQKLRHDIQCNIDKMLRAKNTGGVFVRMSNRSPKDGTPLFSDGNSFSSIYQSILADNSTQDLNDKMIKICSAQMKFLLCPDSDHVMNLLLTSERVFTDLTLALECHRINPKDEWSTSVVLREWQPELREEFEFRVFVHDGKVTAVSQYNPYCAFPRLTALLRDAQHANALLNQIESFVNHIHPLVKEKNYIIDVALINDKIQIVELNPFAPSTGACLFSWQTDRNILCGSTNKPEVRIKQAPMENLQNFIENMVQTEEVLANETREPYSALLDNVSRKSAPMRPPS